MNCLFTMHKAQLTMFWRRCLTSYTCVYKCTGQPQNQKPLQIKSASLIMAAAQCYCGLRPKFAECSPNPLNRRRQRSSGDFTPLRASKSPWSPSFQLCALQPGQTWTRVISGVSWHRKLNMFLGLLSGTSRTFTTELRLSLWRLLLGESSFFPSLSPACKNISWTKQPCDEKQTLSKSKL